MDTSFKGAAKRIEDIDLPRLGHRIGVGEDEMHAFMDVEAAGSGFDSHGRPKMLFEPHVFYRNLTGAKRDRAVKEGLAYKSWKKGAYPKDSYPRLIKAMAIDETAALKAASWGLGQILGENHRLVGYATPQAMVTAFMADEDKHLEAMVEFLIGNKIDDDLRAHRWDVVARVYNGPGYAQHGYHTRLAKAYAKWAKIKDTAWSPGSPAPAPKPAAPIPAPTQPTQPVPPKAAPAPATGGFWAWLRSLFGKEAPMANKQAFVGEMIVGSIVKEVVGAVLTKVAKSPNLSLQKKDVQAVTEMVTKAVENKVMPEVDAQIAHQTNSEAHWYQKRSFWSAIVSGAMVVGGPLLARYGLPIDPLWTDFVVTTLTTVGGLWAGYLAVRAGTATKPLGE